MANYLIDSTNKHLKMANGKGLKLQSHINAEAVMWVIRIFFFQIFFEKDCLARLYNVSDKALERLDTLKERLDLPLH